jgi:hypothetical protein
MPITRSEALFFTAGYAAGVATGVNLPKLKEKLGPLVASARDVVGDSYTEVARKVAEQVEVIQDTIAERRQARAAEPAAASSNA